MKGHQQLLPVEIGLRLGQLCLCRRLQREVFRGVELDQHVALAHELVVLGLHVGDHRVDARRNVVEMARDVGVVGLLMGEGVGGVKNHHDEGR